ncbi:peptide ABC transporter permease [Fictibacillus phosphorivorans]|uniref:peptide ABC transporter permease n=1 Tax=Fictibacillus phosphorivorans TaxID=1221500 RepID=UPI0020414B4E|nr:peptide ABC transporter permease [Fictibacillus phosphorivorans]MCM3719447.1 peptide ABC transporter permease [Fictibacillus phosphorivorans]MCM3777075.1 peptide ABC transporter permease [Fictibacillus phosphorivorans]
MVFRKILYFLSIGYVGTLLLISIFYYFKTGDVIPEVKLQFENGNALSPPYSPLEHFPLGTDNKSKDIFYIILTGAKYTLGIALLITSLRVVICLFLGAVFGTYLSRGLKYIKGLVDSWHYFPTTLAVYLILYWILIQDALIDGQFTLTFSERVLIQITVMVLIGILPLFYLLANEFANIKNLEFIEGVKVLGGKKTYILFKHAPKFILPKLRFIFLQEVIHVLLLLVHLGVMGMLLGGSVLTKDLFENEIFTSLTNEWSGLIGLWSRFLWTTYAWMPFIPITLLTVTILSMQYIVDYLKELELNKQVKDSYVKINKKNLEKNKITTNPSNEKFVYLQKKGS